MFETIYCILNPVGAIKRGIFLRKRLKELEFKQTGERFITPGDFALEYAPRAEWGNGRLDFPIFRLRDEKTPEGYVSYVFPDAAWGDSPHPQAIKRAELPESQHPDEVLDHVALLIAGYITYESRAKLWYLYNSLEERHYLARAAGRTFKTKGA